MKCGHDKLGNIIDLASHPTHAMNPVDRAHYRAHEWEEPPARHFFRCMFCGALDGTRKAAVRCPWGARS